MARTSCLVPPMAVTGHTFTMPAFDNVTLHTSRLLLRPLRPADTEGLLAAHSDPEVMRYSNMSAWTSIEQANELVEQGQRGAATGKHLCLGIIPRDAGTVVGTCTLYALSASNRRAEIGFLLGAAAWRKGYMAEALNALVQYSFLDLALNRLEADTDPRNARAITTLERLGFVREGHLRERWIVGAEKSDSAFYGLLFSDWESVQGSKARSGA
jgi:[ribosomal protein S5]-alanine N-acetyltransferase